MFHRIGNNARPLVRKLNSCRSLCTKRNIPVNSPSSRDLWSDFFRGPRFVWHGPWRSPFREMEDMMRAVESVFQRMTPRAFDVYYTRPRDVPEGSPASEVSKLKYDNKVFELKLDVQNFAPNELEVKLAGDCLTVRGKHEQKADEHGFVSREFHRQFTVPAEVDADSFHSWVSDDGILTVRAVVKNAGEPPAKTIEIKTETKKADDKTGGSAD
ncbi:alpha-crystallin B chain-like [Dreissena polymorpha]|uniref:SHSP domain-containing protein n=1 Tax=Dreissena polymorpha TaxID=45954 RepID=A0A9D4KMQ6_DREPO|nr:alpha-crystallin B chain-like [Dreissena polymorpha]KAH3842735.1 hypothetical protein DPMN_116239 [Dreissena polymorpha]